MTSRELRELLRPVTLTQVAIWYAFTAANVMYVAIAYLLSLSHLSEEQATAGEGLSLLFYALAVVMAAAGYLYRRNALTDESLKKRLARQDPRAALLSGHAASRLGAERSRQLSQLLEPDQLLFCLAQSLMTMQIITLALFEAVALLGLMLVILQQRPEVILPFAVFAMLLNLTAYPRPLAVIERAARWAMR